MAARYVSIWFRYLTTDWFSLQQTHLRNLPFVLKAPFHGKMLVTSANKVAEQNGITPGIALADARAIVPDLVDLDEKPELPDKLLNKLAEWCIRFTPSVAVDPPDGLILDVTGCPHLWGGDKSYISSIYKKLTERGYYVNLSIADTPGTASAMARYGRRLSVIPPDEQKQALLNLPPEALRLENDSVEKLHKLGLHQIGQFIDMPRTSLRKRFGPQILLRIDQALGQEMEFINPVIPSELLQEWLPCLEPITTAIGIEIALTQLLEKLCLRLMKEQKGLRKANLKGYRVDGEAQSIKISTSRPTHHVSHLLSLFKLKIATIEPGFGIELFILEAPVVEPHWSLQEKMWQHGGGLSDERLAELVNKLSTKSFVKSIKRYLPKEHHWPERSYRKAQSLVEEAASPWRDDKLRPLQLLPNPEPIEVTAPIPDYPPMLFRHRNNIHKIVKADGPERIEQEWWIQQGQHRDYYYVEDESGQRYWLFRLGHYEDESYQWFLHGFFS